MIYLAIHCPMTWLASPLMISTMRSSKVSIRASRPKHGMATRHQHNPTTPLTFPSESKSSFCSPMACWLAPLIPWMDACCGTHHSFSRQAGQQLVATAMHSTPPIPGTGTSMMRGTAWCRSQAKRSACQGSCVRCPTALQCLISIMLGGMNSTEYGLSS